MGQQQLLLLVLGIVIVGLAVIVGIQAFGENARKSNADALVNDAVRIASDAQAWKLKPAQFGGGANEIGMSGFSFDKIGYRVDADGDYSNLNGVYEANPSNTDLQITGESEQHDNAVLVRVHGTSSDCIATAVGTVAAPPAPADAAKPTTCTEATGSF